MRTKIKAKKAMLTDPGIRVELDTMKAQIATIITVQDRLKVDAAIAQRDMENLKTLQRDLGEKLDRTINAINQMGNHITRLVTLQEAEAENEKKEAKTMVTLPQTPIDLNTARQNRMMWMGVGGLTVMVFLISAWNDIKSFFKSVTS